MSRKINSSFKCEICRKEVLATKGNQRTCLGHKCRLKIRSKNRKIKRRIDRKENPLSCIWCGDPISKIGKRKYHLECRADKNRLRMREYNTNGSSNPVTEPRAPRVFKGTVVCVYCAKEVSRTGPRQLTCVGSVCQKRRTNEGRQALRAEKKRFAEELAKKKAHAQKSKRKLKDTYERATYGYDSSML